MIMDFISLFLLMDRVRQHSGGNPQT